MQQCKHNGKQIDTHFIPHEIYKNLLLYIFNEIRANAQIIVQCFSFDREEQPFNLNNGKFSFYNSLYTVNMIGRLATCPVKWKKMDYTSGLNWHLRTSFIHRWRTLDRKRRNGQGDELIGPRHVMATFLWMT